ncbi:MAG: DNA gyrase subunit B [Patescibacteria group bacterium]|nr:DNA gyrase subunit B [Patescibacteria group bacterium]MCL5257990.1 DNA gyrase subunit B [Patescibacteria group bacterium]
MSQTYKAEDIQVLEGIEAVRKRPGMYIGTTGPDGVLHLLYEIVGNAIDEAIAGQAKNIEVRIKKNQVLVKDDGRGIPVEIHPKTNKSALETVLTYLHAGGKFDHKVYKVSGGLHGVGLSVVNALSKNLKAISSRDGCEWSQEYKRGVAVTELKRGQNISRTGTTIIFEPDPEIFPEISFERRKVLDYLRHQAFLTPGVRFNFYDDDDDFGYGFYFEDGLKSFVNHLSQGKKLVQSQTIIFAAERQDYQFRFALAWTESQDSQELAFTNNIFNPDGGTHLIGFKSGLVKVFNEVGRELNLLKDKNLIAEDLRSGLIAIISLNIQEPQFEGQTKARLGNPEAKTIVENETSEFLKEYFGKKPAEAKSILQRLLVNFEARRAAKMAKQAIFKKRITPTLALSGKLADCSSHDISKREIFIVEGDSAGGSCKQARDRISQAVLPLRGKILNVEKAGFSKLISSVEIKNLIVALGAGVGQEFKIDDLRYGKIIIASDADVDGNHIRTLLLTLFYRYFRGLIENGFLYIAQPPLYKIQAGKEINYAYSDEERNRVIKNFQTKKKTIEVQRYKGLGEMNVSELWQTTLNPEERVLKQIDLKDAEAANTLFSLLMGEEVEPRKKFIETYAREVQNLDI